jgi:hypothetical protein
LLHIRNRIRIVAILALIPGYVPSSQVKPHEISRRQLSQPCSGDGIALVSLVNINFGIPTATWLPKIQFVIRAIVVYWDVLVGASDPRVLKRHFRCHIVKGNSIANPRCCHADRHGRQ